MLLADFASEHCFFSESNSYPTLKLFGSENKRCFEVKSADNMVEGMLIKQC